MKTRIIKIWGVALALIVVVSMLIAAIPVSAGELSWGTYTTPSTSNNILAPAGTDIVDIAVSGDGNTVYAATGATGTFLYKSTNGGKTWSSIGGNLPAAVTRADLVAVAPDDANVITVADATAAFVVAVSTNGGTSFSSLGVPTDPTIAAPAIAIYDLAISQLSAGAREVGVASTTGANAPALFYFNLGSAVPSWTNAVKNGNWTVDAGGLGAGFTGAVAPADTTNIDTIKAVAFSPYFASDLTAVAVSEQIGAAGQFGKMRFHILSFNQKKWDATAAVAGYPVIVKSAAAIGNAFTVNQARISLDPAYLGGDDSTRISFVGADITDAAAQVGGIFRLKDTSVANIDATIGIWSISWNGINLVAGPTLSNSIRRSADALTTSPTISTASAYKRPGLDGVDTKPVVAYAGANVVGGVTGASSAFAISADNGATFTDTSLIDTATATIGVIEDLQVAADGSKIYMLTNDGVNTSLWLKTDAWYRVWAIAGKAGYLCRIAPDNQDVLYIADTGATAMFYTETGGGKWFQRTSRYNVADLAVEAIDTTYVAISASTSVSKSTNKAFTWGDSKSTGVSLGTIYSVNSLSKDTSSSVPLLATSPTLPMATQTGLPSLAS